jgi:antirestriction protein ArdC
MTGKAKVDVRAEIAAAFVDALNRGIVPWRKPYRGVNAMYLGMLRLVKGYSSPVWFTYNAAKAKGGNVKAGEKATRVVHWTFIDKVDAKTGKKQTIPLVNYFNVFNRDQCEGLPEETAVAPKSHTPIELAERIIAGMPNAPRIVVTDSSRAFYVPSLDSITMPMLSQFHTPEDYYHTMFHELAHSTGHESRLNRELSGPLMNRDSYSREELIAEITAAFVSAEAGTLDKVQDNSEAYVQGWAKALGSDPKLIHTAATAAQKAADYILGGGDTTPEGEGNTDAD